MLVSRGEGFILGGLIFGILRYAINTLPIINSKSEHLINYQTFLKRARPNSAMSFSCILEKVNAYTLNYKELASFAYIGVQNLSILV